MLKIKFWRIENVIVMKILEQGDEIKRGDFKFVASNGIKLRSATYPQICTSKLFIQGKFESFDKDVEICTYNTSEEAKACLKSYIEAVREYNNSLQQSVDKDSVDKDVVGTVENIRAVIVGGKGNERKTLHV